MPMLPPSGAESIAPAISRTPVASIAALFTDAEAQALETDNTKLRGMYADMLADGSIWKPSGLADAVARAS
jgi:hypothetical protein